MVWHVDNKTAPLVKPRKQPVFSQEVRHFTDEIGQTPTVPQADWFNMVQGELLGIADALNITRDKLDDNQIGNALKTKLSDAIPKAAITHENGTAKDKVASQFLVSEIYKAVKEALRQAVPVGFVANYVGDTAPNSDWLIMRGQKYSKDQYQELYSLLKTDTLPDGRGVMLRGLDAGRGLDPGRSLLSYQGDMFQSHRHTINTTYGASDSGFGVLLEDFVALRSGSGNPPPSGGAGYVQINYEGGGETVSKNIAINIIIKVK